MMTVEGGEPKFTVVAFCWVDRAHDISVVTLVQHWGSVDHLGTHRVLVGPDGAVMLNDAWPGDRATIIRLALSFAAEVER